MIPPPKGGSGSGTPTGVVFKRHDRLRGFERTASSQGLFLFATEDGTISGWAPQVDLTHALLAVDNSLPAGVDGFALGAVYKGLATGNDGSGNFIYATNFRDGVVEMYDGKFSFVNSFTDPTITRTRRTLVSLPSAFKTSMASCMSPSPCKTLSDTNDVKGPGSGFIDVFDLNGSFLERFATAERSTRPGAWRLPASLREVFGRLLVGNFGDGRITGFKFEATLSTVSFAVVRAIPSPLTAFGIELRQWFCGGRHQPALLHRRHSG